MKTLQDLLEKLRQNDATLIYLTLGRFTLLKSVNFDDSQLTETDYVTFADALSHNNTIKSLIYCQHGYGFRKDVYAVGLLISALEKNQSIMSLDLSGTQLNQKQVLALSNVLSVNSTLTSLNLRKTDIGDNIQYLSLALATNCTLTSLNLSRNNMYNSDLKTGFIAILKTNTSLRSLDLSYNEFDETSTFALMEALIVNSTLTSLNVTRCGIEHHQLYYNNGFNNYCRDLRDNNKTLLILDGIAYDNNQEIDQYIQRNVKLHYDRFIEFVDVVLMGKQVDLKSPYHYLNSLELSNRLRNNDNKPNIPQQAHLESYQMLVAMQALLEGYSFKEIVSLLNEPIEGFKQHKLIAGAIYAVALFVHEHDSCQLYARYALLAYNTRFFPNSLEFIVGILGMASQQGTDQTSYEPPSQPQVSTFRTHLQHNPKQLPNQVIWLDYSEIQTIANTALLLLDDANNTFEHDFLNMALSQHDYCPVTVDFLFASPLFVTCLLGAYPNHTKFQCLEGYLKLQSMPSLGGVYDAMATLPISDPQDKLNHYQAAMSQKKTAYPNVQIEIATLKNQLMHATDSNANKESLQSSTTPSLSSIGMFSTTNTIADIDSTSNPKPSQLIYR